MDLGALTFASARAIATAVREGQVSAREVVETSLERIAATDNRLRAFRHVDADGARAAAAALDAARARGAALGPLAGVPLAVKEQVAVAGLPREVGSLLMRGNREDTDGPAVARLRAAGAVIMGMTAMPEFGHLAFGHSPLGPATRNPWSAGHTPGGSSSGSAAALAAGQVALALGTDGGGSIRIPASCCGVVGHKPTLGRVPHAPLRSGFSPMSHLGPMARSVADASLLLDVIAGQDHVDPASLPPEDVSYSAIADDPPLSGRIAWAPRLGRAEADPQVVEPCQATVRALADDGFDVTDVDPFLDDWTEAWAVIFDVSLALNVGRPPDEMRGISDATLVARVAHGLSVSAAEFLAAEAARRDVWAAFERLYRDYDVVMTPTLLQPPLPVDPATGVTDKPDSWVERWFQHMYPFNLTGQPAVTIPAGLTAEGLPIGLQVVGPRLDDGVTLGFAAAAERRTGWDGAQPTL
ncbi:MAG: amidase family protein [Chloroflexi bacterium]|nr:amidase family protein [Chloroflexota bacterium]